VPIEAAIRQYLLSQPATTNLIADRLYPMVLPQPPTLPSVTYSRVSRSGVRDLTGVAYWVSRFQFSCWAERYSEAKNVAQAVRQALEDYVGTMGVFRIIGSGSVNEIDLSEPDTGLYHVPVDVLITHQGGE
jgi:hypothetical protein